MSNSAEIVYKYFDLIDGFIRVRILSQEESLPALQKGAGEPPSRREYRRMVVESCVVGVAQDVLPKVHAIYPEDTIAAEDLLYQIVIDVNPNLEIHSVALPVESEFAMHPDEAQEFLQRAAGLERRSESVV